MTEAKPFASLSSTLLARKGAARPAMRPQIQLTSRPVKFGLSARCAPHEDDLGWNDMGDDLPAFKADKLSCAVSVAAKSASGAAVVIPLAKAAKRKVTPRPAVESAATGEPQIAQRPRRKALTLRVEQDCHLQLRLACTVQNRTVQSLLSEALDRLLSDIPGVRELAARIRQDG